jgi:solute carrier family 31 (copper transporter), member 1
MYAAPPLIPSKEGKETDSLIDPQMLFTWNTKDLCIVFRWWHISGTTSLIISLLAVVALGAAYEALRSATRRYETFVNKRAEELPSKPYLP